MPDAQVYLVPMSPLEKIWAEYNADFPAKDASRLKLIKVPKMLSGTAAFPVSSGLIRQRGSDSLLPFPTQGVMFIGNDPDSVGNYNQRAKSGFSNGDREQPKRNLMPYWKAVYRILGQATARGANLCESDCFFTNVYPALREGDQNTGGSRADSKFLEWCLKFLGTQVSIMAPRIVVVFRREACRSVGLGGDEKSDVRVSDTRISVQDDVAALITPVVCMWHPSRRPHPGFSSQAELDELNTDCLINALGKASRSSNLR
ncbi:MAG: hypothetical protein JWL69_4843 [Phycisphaerales bacterium]|nr:hypothetical protein [Phycisphaerales bacterium]MDB5354804.1 hypothetical protein [Phycisphaerales bacterium]